MQNLPATVASFVEQERHRAETLGVTCLFVDEPTAPYLDSEDMRVGGYFAATPPTLAVAVGKPWTEWFPVFVHEACHMDQWSEQCEAWTGNTMPDGLEAVEWLDAWCANERALTPEELNKALVAAQHVEMDCEKRVLAKIEQFGLPLNKEEYAQKANAYVHFYSHMLKTKKWYPPQRAPYELQEVWGEAPTTLTEVLPIELAQAFEAAYPLECAPCKKKMALLS